MNQKQERFSEALGEIDSRYLEEVLSASPSMRTLKKEETSSIRASVHPTRKAFYSIRKSEDLSYKVKKALRYALPVAACLCLAVTGIGVGLHTWQQTVRQASEHRWPIKEIPNPTLSGTDGSQSGQTGESNQLGGTDEIAEIPHWEDLPLYLQYNEIRPDDPAYAGMTYTARGAEIPPELLREATGISDDSGAPATAVGWDEYADIDGKDGTKSCRATIYEIAGISRECAVAVRYAGSGTYYPAVNSYYRPQTLGQFAEALDLAGQLQFPYAFYESPRPDGETATIRFESLDTGRIWSVLSTCLEAENEYDDLDAFPFEHEKLLDFSINIPLLGYENISISLWDGGYLETNILDTGKRFRIGEEAVQELLDYVLNECEGYEIVYTYEGEGEEDLIGIPE